MSPGAVDALVGGASLAGKHAWVTGAGSGIGRASAVALARLGATAHLVGRTAESLRKPPGWCASTTERPRSMSVT